MAGLRQTVSLDDKCILSESPGIVMHELLHVLGSYHEHRVLYRFEANLLYEIEEILAGTVSNL
jgi:hypothetical protein